jgi:hypothetical protein
VQPIFDASCTSSNCHDAASPAAELALTAGASHPELVGVPADQCSELLLVAPGMAQQSYLVQKLTGLDLCNGNQMPKQLVALPWVEAATITRWICSGAPND